MLKTKILNWGHVWDLGELYDEPRLLGIEVAIVESGVRGARMNLVTLPEGVAPSTCPCVQCPIDGKPSTT
jgi:hypothetical protein